MSIRFSRLSPALGIEVSDIDLDRDWGAALAETVGQLLTENKLLLFRRQRMTPERLRQIAEVFGQTEKYPAEYHVPGFSDVMQMDSAGRIRYNVWHSDGAFNRRIAGVIALYAQVIPSVGGDTIWSNLGAAYEALSEPMQGFLDNLVGVHDVDTVRRQMKYVTHYGNDYDSSAADRNPSVEHPLVRRNATTGKKSLFISPHSMACIKPLGADENRVLLEFLQAHAIRPEFGYRHRWQEGDLMLWDNTSTLHYALADYTERRVMLRVSTLDGAATRAVVANIQPTQQAGAHP